MVTASPDTPVGALPITIRDGYDVPWTFQRCDDGSVHVETGTPDDESAITLPPAQWASVVARVSWAGSTPDRYRKAHRFHAGDEPTCTTGAPTIDDYNRAAAASLAPGLTMGIAEGGDS